jgi:hypothetical protein
MFHLHFFFAALADGLTPRGNEPEHRFTTNDMLVVATAALLVGLVLVIWAVFFRKKPEQIYEYPKPAKAREDAIDDTSADGERRRRRKRRRVRDHRPRNPTLHQTGGLPPPRPEDQPPPY